MPPDEKNIIGPGLSPTPSFTPGTDLSKITSADLAPQTDLDFKQPEPTPVFPVASLDTTLTKPETEAQDITSQIQRLNEQLIGQSALRTTEEQRLGIPELQKTQADLAGRLKLLQAEAQSIPISIQQEFLGRGATRAGVQVIESAPLRENAIKA